MILKVILNDELSKTIVLKAAFDNCLFKVSVESQNLLFILRKLRNAKSDRNLNLGLALDVSTYLFIKLNEVRLKHLRDISVSKVILVHSLTIALVFFSLSLSDLCNWSRSTGHRIKGHRDILSVSNLL